MATAQGSFYGLGLAPGLLQVLDALKFTVPTPIQHKAIPIAIEGKDIIGIAQTGTGKTLAFGIPMIQRLAQKKGKGLVLAPTRELALQINEALGKLAPTFRMRSAVIIGGEPMHRQVQALRNGPRILIATPGRLLDHIEQRQVRLDDVCILVLDEADRMLDMGFAPQIERILRLIPKDRQTMLFSATIPASIVKIAAAYMQMPVRTEIAPTGTAAERVSQELFVVSKDRKERLLGEILTRYTASVLLFVRTKRGAQKVTRRLKTTGHPAAEIHSNRSLSQRKEALAGFKSGKYRILVATDIAARGIDVTGIELVVNYDLPDDPEVYVHRIGRTGRAGREGHAITFATPDQGKDVQSIEKIIRTSIPLAQHPGLPPERFSSVPKSPAPQQHPRHDLHRQDGFRRHRYRKP
ncbi:MAG: DEAD/DEAH box helicase [Candidatus Omnitrophica bacterium]|nr:DEAD/DEAH box helicase [Candidatus Omnitrophota bacterium]